MGTLGRAVYTVGFWVRESGQALDRLGCRLQGNYFFQEQCTLSLSLLFSFLLALKFFVSIVDFLYHSRFMSDFAD